MIRYIQKMLFTHDELKQWINPSTIKGIIHIGAHMCEERDYYINDLNCDDSKVIWLEGNPSLVEQAQKQFPTVNIQHALCTKREGEIIDFQITNNGQSSSILPLGTHMQHHPWVHVSEHKFITSTTLDVIQSSIKDVANFINIDVQGAELLVLEGGINTLKHIDYIYAEVNEEELYKGCALIGDLDTFLQSQGFTRVLTKITDWKWGDALYVKSK